MSEAKAKKTYIVTVPIQGEIYIKIDADNEQDAIRKAEATACIADFKDENWSIVGGSYATEVPE